MTANMSLSEKNRKRTHFDEKLCEHEQKFRLIQPTGDVFQDAKVSNLDVHNLRAELLRLRNVIVTLQEKRSECEGELQFEITRLKCENRRLAQTSTMRLDENRALREELKRLKKKVQWIDDNNAPLSGTDKPSRKKKPESIAEQALEQSTKTAVISSQKIINSIPNTSTDLCWQKQPHLEQVLLDLRHGSTLELILEEKQIQDISPLTEPLGMNRSCRLLNLCNNRIVRLLPFKQCLKRNTTLCKLFLSHNGIKDVAPLAQGLRTNSGLWELSLSGNLIDNVTPLAEALRDNKGLLKLYLSNNRIEDISSFSKTLAVNQRLQRLDLSHNFVDTIGDLPNLLHKARFLKRLDLEKNPLGVFQRMQLKRGGEKNSIHVKLT